MTRVSGGRSRNVGLLNDSKWAVVDMVGGRRVGGQLVRQWQRDFQLLNMRRAKTWLFGDASQEAVGVRALKLIAGDGKQPGEEGRKVKMKKTQILNYTGDEG